MLTLPLRTMEPLAGPDTRHFLNSRRILLSRIAGEVASIRSYLPIQQARRCPPSDVTGIVGRSTPAAMRLNDAAHKLNLWYWRRNLVRVHALSTSGIHGRRHVEIGCAILYRRICVIEYRNQRRVDLRVRTPAHRAAINVVTTHRRGAGIPG